MMMFFSVQKNILENIANFSFLMFTSIKKFFTEKELFLQKGVTFTLRGYSTWFSAYKNKTKTLFL